MRHIIRSELQVGPSSANRQPSLTCPAKTISPFSRHAQLAHHVHASNVQPNHPRALQHTRHVIVAGDMNDYDGRVLDSFGHKPTSTALQLMAEAGGDSNTLVSAGEHVDAQHRFTDW